MTEPETVWVCAACGKVNTNKTPDQFPGNGWDESCMLHAVRCTATPIAKILAGEPKWTACQDQSW